MSMQKMDVDKNLQLIVPKVHKLYDINNLDMEENK
jgi:hypothetical protein